VNGQSALPGARRGGARTRERILTEAISEFADRGFDGTRVDDIAARTATTKRMIYYYFGSKDDLFVAALQSVIENEVLTAPEFAEDPLGDPVASVRWLVRSTMESADQHRERVRLLSIANIHAARHLTRPNEVDRALTARLDWFRAVLQAGADRGVFRIADVLDLYLMIHAMSDFRVAHRASTQALLDIDMQDPAVRERHITLVADMVLAYLRP